MKLDHHWKKRLRIVNWNHKRTCVALTNIWRDRNDMANSNRAFVTNGTSCKWHCDVIIDSDNCGSGGQSNKWIRQVTCDGHD